MTTIQLAYEVPAGAVAKIEAHLAQVALHDPDWNGATFTIERGEHTCILDNGSEDAAVLLNDIISIIRAE